MQVCDYKWCSRMSADVQDNTLVNGSTGELATTSSDHG
jgi:hypothetical protein